MTESTEVAKRDEAQAVERSPQTVLAVFSSTSFRAQVAAALPAHIPVESMMRIALTEVRMNPELQKCTVPSFMGALLKAAQSGLRPGMFGEGWILPRWNNKLGSLEAQFQPGYMGLAQLAYRSGEVADIVAEPVYEADHFRYQLGSDPKIEHVPDMDAEHRDEEIIAFYAVVKLVNGGRLMKVMPKRDVDVIRDTYGPHTKAGKLVGPWTDSYPAMGAKTVLIQTLKLAPKESERLQAALQAEQDAIFGDRVASGIVETRPVAQRVAERIGVDTETGEFLDVDPADVGAAGDRETARSGDEDPAGLSVPQEAPETPTEAEDEPSVADNGKASRAQINQIRALLKKSKLSEPEARDYMQGIAGTDVIEDLSHDGALAFIEFLSGKDGRLAV